MAGLRISRSRNPVHRPVLSYHIVSKTDEVWNWWMICGREVFFLCNLSASRRHRYRSIITTLIDHDVSLVRRKLVNDFPLFVSHSSSALTQSNFWIRKKQKLDIKSQVYSLPHQTNWKHSDGANLRQAVISNSRLSKARYHTKITSSSQIWTIMEYTRPLKR